MRVSVESAIVFLNGFQQGLYPGEGLYSLYERATQLWYDRRQDLVLHRTWNSNHDETASLIHAHAPDKIYFVGYSYGCGWGLTQLADELDDCCGLDIDAAFLIDPVRRYSVQKWRSLGWLSGDLIYKCPPNVRECYSWRQVNDNGPFEPVGHRVERTDSSAWLPTTIHPEMVLGSQESLLKRASDVPANQRRICPDCSHENIDSNPTIRREVLEHLIRLNAPPRSE